MSNVTLNDVYQYVTYSNEVYSQNRDRWQYLMESYSGGDEYRRANHLVRYELETGGQYQQRLLNTPLDNHCQSVVSVYSSFLFRTPPQRDLGSLTGMAEVDRFLRDADLDGRSLDAFMKDVCEWSSVYGHMWVMVTRPSVEALSRFDEVTAGVQPYVTMLSPLVVMDWNWVRRPNGRYELDYIKYVEDINDSAITVRAWYPDHIETYVTNERTKDANITMTEPNGLGYIPAVLVYNRRGVQRAVGVSDIGDIADQQRAIYNELSEIEQGIRLDGHPSLVKTPDTEIGSGAGSLVHIPANLDPGLKPYLLTTDGTPIDMIYKSIRNRVDMIDRMANTGSVRAVETREISGIAMQTEFQLLNARLAGKANNLALAEEQMFKIIADFYGQVWDGEIRYPGSFNITDLRNEYQHLEQARRAATSPETLALIDLRLTELLGGINVNEAAASLALDQADAQAEGATRRYPDGEPVDPRLPEAYQPSKNAAVPYGQQCANCEYYDPTIGQCTVWGNAPVKATWWCARWEAEPTQMIQREGMPDLSLINDEPLPQGEE
jgi:hypothetical protein